MPFGCSRTSLNPLRSRRRSAVAPDLDFDWAAQIPAPRAELVLSEYAAHSLLNAAGLPTARGELVTTAEHAITAAHAIGWPVAMKGMSDEVTHKFAAGLVRLRVDSMRPHAKR